MMLGCKSGRVRPRAMGWGVMRGSVLGVLILSSARLSGQQPKSPMPDSVRDYVRVAMAAFRERSMHRAEVDWPSLEDSVVARADSAQTPRGTWRALTWALRRVDAHSYLLPPQRVMKEFTAGMVPPVASTTASRPVGRLLDGGFGLVVVRAHGGTNRVAYVDSLQSQIRALDSAGVCGWVVDLRENGGGNMWPMLAGIGTLLGAEVVGSMTNSPAGEGWHYRDGRSWEGGSTPPREPLGWGSVAPRPVANANAPVALLVGRETASSGEITLLAFLGRPNVRSFGDSTAGMNSSNASVPLRDSATMYVTSGYPRDRLGRTYPLSVGPDELVLAGDSGSGDAALARAVAWLGRQRACAERR